MKIIIISKNQLFFFLTFCFYGATLEADLARYKCAMNMVDSALEWSDVKVFKHTKTYRVLHTANKSWGSKLPVSSGTSPSCFLFFQSEVP